MNLKQLAVILVLLVVLGGAGFYVVHHHDESWSAPQGRAGQKLLSAFDVNDVAGIRIQGETQVDLSRKDDGWKVRERGDYPANFSQISDLLIKLNDLKVVQSDAIGPSQLGRLHLLEPGSGSNAATVLELQGPKNGPIALLVGKKHFQKQSQPAPGPFGDEGYPDGRYVMLKSDPGAVLTISDPLASVDPKPSEWLDKTFFKIEKPSAISLVSTNATNSWAIARAMDNGPWLLAGAATNEVLDKDKASSLSGALGYPSFVDVADASAATGLDHASVVTIETFDHFTYTVKIGAKTPENNYYLKVAVTADLPAARPPGKNEKLEDAKKLDEEFQARMKQAQAKLKQEQTLGQWVYLVSNWTVDPFLRDRAQLLVGKKSESKPGEADEPPPGAPPDADATPLEHTFPAR